MKLIVTRPEPAASRTANKLTALGHDVTVSSLLEIVDTGNKIPAGSFGAMMVTSTNALRILAARGIEENMLQMPLYTVGDATAADATAMGFSNIHSASGTAENLAGLVIEETQTNPDRPQAILYACGVDTTPGLVENLREKRLIVQPWALYKANLVDQLTNISKEWLRNNDPVGVLMYSARSARQFERALEEILPPQGLDILSIFALSPKVKLALTPRLRNRCEAALSPDEKALFNLIPE